MAKFIDTFGELIDKSVHVLCSFYEQGVYLLNVYQPKSELIDRVDRHSKPAENCQKSPFVYLLLSKSKEEEKKSKKGEAPKVLTPMIDTGELIDRRWL